MVIYQPGARAESRPLRRYFVRIFASSARTWCVLWEGVWQSKFWCVPSRHIQHQQASRGFLYCHTEAKRLISDAGILTLTLSRPWRGSHQAMRTDNPTYRYLIFFDGGPTSNSSSDGSRAVVPRLTQDGGPFPTRLGGTMSYASRITIREGKRQKPWPAGTDCLQAEWILPTACSGGPCDDHPSGNTLT